MYEAHWGLEQSPFRAPRDPRFFFCSPSHDEALARLQFLVEQRRRLGLLLGASGVGKSLVLQVLTHRLRRQGQDVVLLSATARSGTELLWQLAAQLGCNPPAAATDAELWRRITEQLAERRLTRRSALVLVDDADAAAPEVAGVLVRLLQDDVHPESWLTVILAANSQRFRKLDSRLLELAELRIEVEPWTADETQAYVHDSLRKAGARGELFQEEAVRRLYEATQGVPRKVAQLADLALLAGAGQQLGMIDERTVDCVHHELCVN